VLLHISSLPSGAGSGDLGEDAHRFVDFLADAGLTVWQTLPIGPTHSDLSPYQCMSAHAGNPLMINLEWLVSRGWLSACALEDQTSKDAASFRRNALSSAYHGFCGEPDESFSQRRYRAFCADCSYWLNDFALYAALREHFGNTSWQAWPKEYRDREPQAIRQAMKDLASKIGQIRFEQFVFFSQWAELRRHAQAKGVLLFGDMPIFVAVDSAEVWAERWNFDLDADGSARVVAGVPPDYFSETGQRWGNPHYLWEKMEQDGFEWWINRLRTQLALYDLIRIDHFRGFEAYWEIPASEPTALNGRWVKAPGEALLRTMFEHFGGRSLPLVAENLGIITDEVESMRNRFGIPGMLILQFAFDGSEDNPYLPKNHTSNNVVYTGTHDNDTTVSWFSNLSEDEREKVRKGMDGDDAPMPWGLIASAFKSEALLAIVPLQDFLELGAEGRMNVPGTLSVSNWSWRFDWKQLNPSLPQKIRSLAAQFGRN
jgi:4-alpha-glucanotransferase